MTAWLGLLPVASLEGISGSGEVKNVMAGISSSGRRGNGLLAVADELYDSPQPGEEGSKQDGFPSREGC